MMPHKYHFMPKEYANRGWGLRLRSVIDKIMIVSRMQFR